jgi:Protein of unknown function (DUF3300)
MSDRSAELMESCGPVSVPAWCSAKSLRRARPQSVEQIQALVAPITLYPDALVAQVLSVATFPDQVALAENWLEAHKDLTGQKLMKEVDKPSWDPSM